MSHFCHLPGGASREIVEVSRGNLVEAEGTLTSLIAATDDADRRAAVVDLGRRHGGVSDIRAVWRGAESSVSVICQPPLPPLPFFTLVGAEAPQELVCAAWSFLRHLLHWWILLSLHLPLHCPLLKAAQILLPLLLIK